MCVCVWLGEVCELTSNKACERCGEGVTPYSASEDRLYPNECHCCCRGRARGRDKQLKADNTPLITTAQHQKQNPNKTPKINKYLKMTYLISSSSLGYGFSLGSGTPGLSVLWQYSMMPTAAPAKPAINPKAATRWPRSLVRYLWRGKE